MHVAILGAGVIGVTTAFALAKRGCKVTIFDQANSVAAGASYANGAQLSYSFVDPMASPAMLKKIPSILLGKDPNSKQDLSLAPDHLKWGAHFVGNCIEPKVNHNLKRAITLSLESRDALRELLDQHSISFRYKRAGKLVVTRSVSGLRNMQRAAEVKSARGIDMQILKAGECWELEPAIKQHFGDIVGGVYAPDDHVGDARRFTTALSHICGEEYGVEVKLKQKVRGLASVGNQVVGVQTDKGVCAADSVVVCLGAGSAPFLKSYDIPVLIEPIKGYSFTIPASDQAPSISLTDADNKLVFARLQSEVRIAGLADYDGEDMSLREHRLNSLKDTARRLFPAIGDYDHSGTGWVGARPMTPDGLPITGKTKIQNLFLNTGHGMLGWTFACGSAERIAKMITNNGTEYLNDQRAAQ